MIRVTLCRGRTARASVVERKLQHRCFNGDGRTDGLRPSRASLHIATRQYKKEKSTRQVLSVLRVDFNYSDALGVAIPPQTCGIASSRVVRLAATSLELVELVNKALLERNSDHDAGLKRGEWATVRRSS